MRRFALIAAAAFSLAACSNDTTSPQSADFTIADAGAFGTALTVAGGYDAQTYQNRLINGLPDELRLTDYQRAQIRALVDAFEQSTRQSKRRKAAPKSRRFSPKAMTSGSGSALRRQSSRATSTQCSLPSSAHGLQHIRRRHVAQISSRR